MRIEFTPWKGRVARSMFLLFLACSFVPLITQSLFAGFWVGRELIDQADERLTGASRAAQMSLVDGVQNLERSFELIAVRTADLGTLPATLDPRLQATFTGLELVDAKGNVTALGTLGERLDLSESEHAFVELGHTQLGLRESPDGRLRAFLARQIEDGAPGPQILIAWVHPDFFTNMGRLASAESELLVTDSTGLAIFSTQPNLDLEQLYVAHEPGESIELQVDGQEYLGSSKTVFMAPQFGTNWRVLYYQAKADILAPASKFRYVFLLVMALTFWVVLLASFKQIQRVLRPLQELLAGTHRVSQEDFGTRVEVETDDEFQELAESFNTMSSNLEHSLQVSRELTELGMTLSGENDSQRAIALVLRTALSLLQADSGCVVLIDEDGGLRIADVLCDSRLPRDPSEARLRVFSSNPPRSCVAHATARGETLCVSDWTRPQPLNLTEESVFEHDHGLQRRAVITTLMRDHEGELIGTLQLGRRLDGSQRPFDEEETHLLESMAAQCALALSKNNLISGFRRMMLSMTEVFAMAVDEKSPYTGAHCRRVPELAMMLAESARDSSLGSLAEFQPTDEDLFELRVAALLHDCGKVVTPVHVMDKATKLETLHDRIHVVDLRFEVLARDARIAVLEEQLRAAGLTAVDEHRSAALAAQLGELERSRAFLRQANMGVEKMTDESRQRVEAMAGSLGFWNLDGEHVPLLDENEVENLTILYGTLTADERQVINDHIVVTIRMLETLHYPKALRRVPALAGAHHERMDGKGYPKGLTREQMSVQARLMGIADIFEALTAKDRPYKEGKTLTESLTILGNFKQNGHIDPDLFDAFIREKVYLEYAKQFLAPEQIDAVDEARIPGYAANVSG